MNIRYLDKTPEEFDCWLATRPVITPSEVEYDRYTIPGRVGELVSNYGTRGNAKMSFMLHQKITSSTVHSFSEAVAWFTTAPGWIELSTEPNGGGYEVITSKVASVSDIADDYKRAEIEVELYPRRYIIPSLNGTIANANSSITVTVNCDTCEPIYEIWGSGQFWINGNEARLTESEYVRYVDVRKKITYYGGSGRPSAESTFWGDYEALKLLPGTNTITTSAAISVEIAQSREGFII